MGRLTTHVLDTALGRPAAGLKIELFRLSLDSRDLIAEAVTNADGRTAAVLMNGPNGDARSGPQLRDHYETDVAFASRSVLAASSGEPMRWPLMVKIKRSGPPRATSKLFWDRGCPVGVLWVSCGCPVGVRGCPVGVRGSTWGFEK